MKRSWSVKTFLASGGIFESEIDKLVTGKRKFEACAKVQLKTSANCYCPMLAIAHILHGYVREGANARRMRAVDQLMLAADGGQRVAACSP